MGTPIELSPIFPCPHFSNRIVPLFGEKKSLFRDRRGGGKAEEVPEQEKRQGCDTFISLISVDVSRRAI